MIVQLDSITFNNDIADPNGTKWYCQTLEGWDTPNLRSQQIDLPASHGVVTTENLYGDRSITIGGLAKTVPAANAYAAMYNLDAVTNALVTPATLTVTEDVARICTVFRAGPVRKRFVGVGAFTFEIDLRADDPVKYAATPTTVSLPVGTTGPYNNTGSFITYPVITMTSSGQPIYQNLGMVWSANASLPAGTVIDMKKMTVTSGGTNLFQYVVPTSQWPYLVPGANAILATVAASMTYRSAWI